MHLRPCLISLALFPWGLGPAMAEPPALQPTTVTEWKAVFGQIESRDRLPARARLAGTLVALTVAEGDLVKAGQVIGRIEDPKLAFQMTALAAQHTALAAQLANAEAELTRGNALLKQGVVTAQGLDALRTQVQVLKGQLDALAAQGAALGQQISEGAILAPTDGRVLNVPVAKGAVVLAGETVATIAGGGTFLRLSIPERHATALHRGDVIEVWQGDAARRGTLSRIYPLIENGRVTADVELPGLSDVFVDARVLVRLPVGHRQALVIPAAAVKTQAGLDFVRVQENAGSVQRAVVPGEHQIIDGVEMVEILSGLQAGDVVEAGNE